MNINSERAGPASTPGTANRAAGGSAVDGVDVIEPEVVAARLAPRFGTGVRAWASTLPGRVAELAGQWGLDVGEVYPTGNSSVAVRCGEKVLKLCPDHSFVTEQVHMLRLFAGSGRVPEVYEHTHDALLMSAVGEPVEQAPPVDDFAALLADLHTAGAVSAAPRTLFDLTEEFFARAERRGVVLGDARRRRDHLVATQPRQVLLHGDLHFGNILGGGPRGLVAIDPKACAGEPCFDAIDYVMDPGDPAGFARRRDNLAEAAGLDADRLDAWCRVVAPVLGWSFMPDGTPVGPGGAP